MPNEKEKEDLFGDLFKDEFKYEDVESTEYLERVAKIRKEKEKSFNERLTFSEQLFYIIGVISVMSVFYWFSINYLHKESNEEDAGNYDSPCTGRYDKDC